MCLGQIIMNCNVPRLGQLVGVGVTVTNIVVVIVINSWDAVSTHDKKTTKKQQQQKKTTIALTWSTSSKYTQI